MIPIYSFDPRALVGPPRIAALDPSHESDFARLLVGLDERSRYCRFLAAVNDRFLENHARDAARTAGFLAGAFIGHDLCGVAEAYVTGDGGSAEAAFVVDAAFRKLGFGTALLDAALDWARRADRRSLTLLFAPVNVPMRRMACRAGGRLAALDGAVEATIALAGSRQP